MKSLRCASTTLRYLLGLDSIPMDVHPDITVKPADTCTKSFEILVWLKECLNGTPSFYCI